MGYTGARAMAESGVDLDLALTWHLTANHFPPHPPAMVPIARAALEVEDYDELILLPEGATYRGEKYVSAGELIDALHLEAFIDADEEG